MRILAIVHQQDAGLGVFEAAAAERGDRVERWRPAEEPPPAPLDHDAVLVLGGGMHADQEDRHPWLRAEKNLLRGLLEGKVPLLGVCLGAQLVAEAAGSPPRRAARPEIGWHEVELLPEATHDPVLGPLAPGFRAFQWHSYEFGLPAGAKPLARSAACLQAFSVGGAAWAIQFHAEVTRGSIDLWLADHGKDDEAPRPAVDVAAVAAESDRAIGGWNRLGRALCRRFLNEAERRRKVRGPDVV